MTTSDAGSTGKSASKGADASLDQKRALATLRTEQLVSLFSRQTPTETSGVLSLFQGANAGAGKQPDLISLLYRQF